MAHSETPVYTSSATKKSMGNTYTVYPDRIELRCRFPFMWKTLVVKKEDLVAIDVFKPPVIRTTWRALKLDLADLKAHVGLERKSGFFKQLRFTPEDPEAFVAKVREAFAIDHSSAA
jgi:hypothetical protein